MAVLIIHENANEIRIHAFKHEGRKLMRHMPKPQWFHYLIGEAKPNYPMPAMPMVVDIAPDYCAVFVWRGPEQTGQYCHCVISNDGDTD